MNRRGFTLLELMTVIAVLAILATVLIPRIGKAMKKAQARECEATRVIATRAEQRYAFEHDGQHSKGLDALLRSGYLETAARCTGGGTYAWVPETGTPGERRVICSIHGDALPGLPGSVLPPTFGQAPAVSTGTAPQAILVPVKPAVPATIPPPQRQADCPPGTDFLPNAYSMTTKTYSPVCAPKCPPGQRRSSPLFVDSCLPISPPATSGGNPPAQATPQCPSGQHLNPQGKCVGHRNH